MASRDAGTWRLLRPAQWPLIAVVVAGVAQSVSVIAQAFVVGGLVAGLVRREPAAPWVVALGVVLVVRAAAGWAGDVAAAAAAGRAGRALRVDVLRRALAAGSTWRASRRTGELAALATRGASAVEPYLTRYLPALVLAAVLPLLSLAAIATQDLLSAVIVALTLPLVPVFAALVGWATRDRAARQWRAMAALAGHFTDVVQGLPTLVAFRRAHAQADSIRGVTDRYRRASLRTLRLAFASSAVLEMVATVSVALVAVAVGLRLAAGEMDLRTGLVVLLLAPEAYWPLRRVGAEFHAAAEGGAALAEIAALPDMADAVRRIAHRNGREGGAAAAQRHIGLSHIELRGVTLTYPGRQTPALSLDRVDLPLRGMTAVTGPSGAGKSTLLEILRAGLAATSGEVLVDGVAVSDLDQQWWRDQVGWLPQRPWFISGSVSDNVRLGRSDASDDEIWEALDQVELAATVATRGGLTADVGEGGRRFSAGERARLALARVLVARRPLVLLDEPTAHLDRTTEAVILDTLRLLAARSAVVVVAHRQAVIDAADNVVVINPPAPSPVPAALAGDVVSSLGPSPAAGRLPDPQPGPRGGRRLGSKRSTVLGTVLGCLASLSGIALTATAGWLIVRAAERPTALALLVAIVAVRTFGIARPVLRYAERLLSHDAALRLLAERRAAVFEWLVPLTPGALGRGGDLLASVVDDVDAYMDRQLRVRQPLVTAAVVSVVAAAVAALVLPVAGVLLGGGLALGGLGGWAAARHGARVHESGYVTARAASYDAAVDALDGADELSSWGAEGWAVGRLDSAGHALAATGVRSAVWAASGRALGQLAAGASLVLLALLAPADIAAGRVSPPMLALIAFLPLALAEVLGGVADAAVVGVRTERSLARLSALRTRAPAVTDPADPVPPAAGARSEVELQAVSARWGDEVVLRDVTLDLSPGSRVAVVGPTGCGKSTLAGLLMRFTDPSSGAVSLSGVDLRRLRLDDVRHTVGLVDDDPHVFGSTLVENIRLARPAATDEEVAEAVRAAHLGPWLDGLPAGLGTWLGDGGSAVSGGERARIGLARVLLSDNPVIVLDEPTAHLDAATAHQVTDDLLGAVGSRSVVLLTHRPEGLDRVDDILDLTFVEQRRSELVGSRR